MQIKIIYYKGKNNAKYNTQNVSRAFILFKLT